jgi:hypothetical protein
MFGHTDNYWYAKWQSDYDALPPLVRHAVRHSSRKIDIDKLKSARTPSQMLYLIDAGLAFIDSHVASAEAPALASAEAASSSPDQAPTSSRQPLSTAAIARRRRRRPRPLWL